MKFYVFFAEKEFCQKYSIFLQQALDWGWVDRPEYLISIRKRDYDRLTSIEKMMLEEMNQLDQINEEIKLLEEAERLKEVEIVLPFPMEGKFKDEFIMTVKNALRANTFNLTDSIIIPFQFREETFMDRIKKIPGVDIDEEIRKCIYYIN